MRASFFSQNLCSCIQKFEYLPPVVMTVIFHPFIAKWIPKQHAQFVMSSIAVTKAFSETALATLI